MNCLKESPLLSQRVEVSSPFGLSLVFPSTVQSFEHGKTTVMKALFAILATLGFWDRGAAVSRKTACVQTPPQQR